MTAVLQVEAGAVLVREQHHPALGAVGGLEWRLVEREHELGRSLLILARGDHDRRAPTSANLVPWGSTPLRAKSPPGISSGP